MAGYIKNLAWEYEIETRFLVELEPEDSLSKIPGKIQIAAEDLWDGAKILCGPCLDPEKFKGEMQKFYAAHPSAIRLNLEDEKSVEKSIQLNRVYFKDKCETCKKTEECPLLKQIENNHA